MNTKPIASKSVYGKIASRKSIVLATAIATVFLIAAVGSASAQNHITDCTVIDSQGLWVIDSDIENSTAVKCIDIQSDDVILDGQWHMINGVTPSDNSKYGIYSMENSNVTIQNVEVTGFYEGIRVGGKFEDEACTYNAEDITIENCTVYDNGASNKKLHGIDFNPCVCNSAINNCTVYNQIGSITGSCGDGGAGIKLHAKSNHNSITNNTVYNNSFAGIHSTKICQHNYVSNNTVYENGKDVPDGESYFGGGIRLQCKKTSFWTVEHNTVTDNWGPGIYVRGKNATLSYNDVSGSKNATDSRGDSSDTGVGDGFFTCGGNQTLILNSFCDNEGEDIYVSTAGSTTGDSDTNTCDTAEGYCDASATCPPPCVFQCVEPDLIIEDIRAIWWCCYSISDMQVMFVDDPEIAKELGDEKLREKVAEALAKDPKLAAEIAVELACGDTKALADFTNEPDEFSKAEFTDAADKLISKSKLVDPNLVARCCCCCCGGRCFNHIPELADLLDTELTAQKQHEMSDLLDQIIGGGCCDDCKSKEEYEKCCCYGRFIVYKIANIGTGDADWSLSNLTVDGHAKAVDIVRPLDAYTSRWEIFPCYQMWWWPHHEVKVCADATNWVVESNETNNCRTEWF